MSEKRGMSSEQLAMEGGPARLPGGPPDWPPPDEAIRQALEAAFRDGSWGRYEGPHSGVLTERLGSWLDVDYVLLVASGTIAVEMALRGLGIGSGDEVILGGYDFSGNFRSIEAVGARPVLVDIQANSWCLNIEALEEAVTPATRAVIVSHLHGCLVPMRRLMELAGRLNLQVLEDACQVPGATVEGRLAGGWGDVGVFSFGGSKLLTAGRGGAVVTRCPQIHQRAKIFYERGNQAVPMSELQAAVLAPQLDRLDERNQQRRESAERLLRRLGHVELLRPAAAPPSSCRTAYYKVPWRLVAETDRLHRASLIGAARAEGVALDEGFRGFTRRGSRRCRRVGSLPEARRAAERTVLLHHPVLLESAAIVEEVGTALEKVVRGLGGC